MSDRIPKKHILDFFALMNDAKINYLLIKNIGGELPDNLKDGKDIDILVDFTDREKFSKCMSSHGYLYRIPPYGKREGWNFGYQLPEYQFWQLGGISQKLYIDACFKLMCKSLMPKYWVPLDESINRSSWEEKEWNEHLGCWQLGKRTLFVYLFVRCVFDKRTFSDAYIAEIEKHKSLVDDPDVQAMLKTLFYKFTDNLIKLIKASDYISIVQRYISFIDY